MRTHSLSAALRLMCVFVLALAVAAGPCQACFDMPVNSSAHSCCPSQKDTRQHQHNSSCSDVQVAVDQSKSTLVEIAADFAPVGSLPRTFVLAVVFDRGETNLAVSHTPFRITTLRI